MMSGKEGGGAKLASNDPGTNNSEETSVGG